KEKPIDASGELPTDDGASVNLTGARDLADYTAGSETGQRGFIVQLFNQMAKQPIQAYGPEALSRAHESFVAKEFHIQKLMVELITLYALHTFEDKT
ncbi:MAG: hypothetical protein AAF492_25065, partial [Verrucomicrobiota bacterium]